METNINEYSREKVCVYKGRRYYVRDNGAVYRQCKEDGKMRKWDEAWTFGKFDENTGYMLLGQERVHRIVCTAYHGKPDDDRNVVDHIDTNRCNNRPENLRWVTRLENTLNNPITRAKVELICGSSEAFLKNPRLLDGHESENSNFNWMRTVTKEEGERSLKRWNEWAMKPVEERMPKGIDAREWLYNPDSKFGETWDKEWYKRDYRSEYRQQMDAIEENNLRLYEQEYGLKDSLTPGAKQLEWKTPTEFPQTPKEFSETPLQDYLSRLTKGIIYCHNQYSDSLVYAAAMSEDQSRLAVLTEISGVTNYALSEVTYENGYFIHKSIRTFFTEEGAKKYLTLSLGKEWDGGDVMEDYC